MKKLVTASIVVAAVAGAVGVTTFNASAMNGNGSASSNGSAQAHAGAGYGQSSWLETRAAALNMTTEQLQTALQTKTMSQVALDQGLSQDEYQAKMNQLAEQRWTDRGLSSEEVAQRVADREARRAAMPDHEFGSGAGVGVGTHGYGHRQ